MEDRVFDFWLYLICQCACAESERSYPDYVLFNKGIITLIRELGVSSDVCSRLWDSIILTGNNIFYEETNNS